MWEGREKPLLEAWVSAAHPTDTHILAVKNAADEYEMIFVCLAEILVMLGSPRSHQYGGSILETVLRLSICDRERDLDVKASKRHQTIKRIRRDYYDKVIPKIRPYTTRTGP